MREVEVTVQVVTRMLVSDDTDVDMMEISIQDRPIEFLQREWGNEQDNEQTLFVSVEKISPIDAVLNASGGS